MFEKKMHYYYFIFVITVVGKINEAYMEWWSKLIPQCTWLWNRQHQPPLYGFKRRILPFTHL